MTMRIEIWREEPAQPALLVTADLVYVNVSVSTMRPDALPEGVRDLVRKYERTPPIEA
jgi:acyl-CoA thioesterase FadM